MSTLLLNNNDKDNCEYVNACAHVFICERECVHLFVCVNGDQRTIMAIVPWILSALFIFQDSVFYWSGTPQLG